MANTRGLVTREISDIPHRTEHQLALFTRRWHSRLWMSVLCLGFGLSIAKPTIAGVTTVSQGIGGLSSASGYVTVGNTVTVTVSGDLGYQPINLEPGCGGAGGGGLPFYHILNFETKYFTAGPHSVTFSWVACSGSGASGGSYTATIIVPAPVNGSGGEGGGGSPPIPSCSASMLLDPVPGLLNGSAVTANWGSFSEANVTAVQGAAADGVTELVIEIAANNVGDQCQLTLFNDQTTPVQSSSPDQDGALGSPGDTSFTQSQITVQAVQTQNGPLAFAIYRSPIDFGRLLPGGTAGESASYPSGSCAGTINTDDQLACRSVSIQIQSTGGLTPSTIPVTILRPPLILIHGFWADWTVWNSFSPLVSGTGSVDPRFYVGRVDYSNLVNVTATIPVYPTKSLGKIRANSLGLQYNAPRILNRIGKWIQSYKSGNNPAGIPVAGVQADIVAHSMGGLIVRYFATFPYFANDVTSPTFGQGTVHKLITIDTTHLGTPVATQLLSSQESCLERFLTVNGHSVLASATTSNAGNVSGAMADLSGQGTTASSTVDPTLSAALAKIAQPSAQPLPTALIAGVYNY